MKTLQEIKNELLHKCEDLYENYLIVLDHDINSTESDTAGEQYCGFKQACEYLGEDLVSNIKRMEDRIHADRYIKSGIDEMLVNAEISGLPTQ